MKKIVLIVEDDIEQLNMLKHLVTTVSKNVAVYTATDAAQAYRQLMEKTVDVFLVDIILDTSTPGDTSGIRLVERLRKIPKYMFAPVIFVTSLEDPALYAYKNLNCLGYIEKPYDCDKVKQLVERALNHTTAREKETTLSFRKDGIFYPVRLREIAYMESQNHIMYIHMSDGAILDIPYKTCRQVLQEEDAGEQLLQCSRGILVNREYVLGIDSTNKFLILKNNLGRLDIGGRYRKKLLAGFEEE